MTSPESHERAQIVVGSTWDGRVIAREQLTWIDFVIEARAGTTSRVRLTWDAPHDALAEIPTASAGFFDELWRFEVVEVFIAGPGEQYLEFEMGPWGHFAAFTFEQRRQRTGNLNVLDYTCERNAGRFQGSLGFEVAELPQGALRWNAHRIAGPADARCYFSANPKPGARPDFHDMAAAVPLIPR